ncbi:MAG: 50S ribosomal protein L11 methyltransferase [Synergistetes bacterium]|nr:50S ribosomal protein L11 methyltransferase [Synergistota bacterium]
MGKRYMEIVVKVRKEDEEALIGLLSLFGVEELWIEMDGDEVIVRGYTEPSFTNRIYELKDTIYARVGDCAFDVKGVGEEDWENSWKKDYEPVSVSDLIEIAPPWFTRKNGRILIKPGKAFGTGYHPTTYLCLEALSEHVSSGDYVLDVGSGSGILSVAAAYLGARSFGVEIDEVAIQEAVENARLNGVDDRCTFLRGDLLSAISYSFDLVVANILAPVITFMIPGVRRNLKTGGYFLASGIMDLEKDSVLEELSDNGFVIDEVLSEGEWVCIVSTA